MMGLSEMLQNPPAENRPKPFWFWNGDMDDEEIERQLEEMADKGLGGAFICARQGMKIPYLSVQWFEKIKMACEKGKELGMENWLYDEYPYPSGVSGGEVLLECPEAKQKVLKIYEYDTEQIKDKDVLDLGWGRILYGKAIPYDSEGNLLWESALDIKEEIGNLQMDEIYQESGLTAYSKKRFFSYGPRHTYRCRLKGESYKILVFSSQELDDFKYYGSYVDACNQKAVKTFLETTHEKYKRHLGAEFGKTIHGMFSDETGILGMIPWSEEMEKEFKAQNGYSLEECLPALVSSTYPNAYYHRYRYFNTLHQLFVESYHRQNSQWCRDNQLQYATEVPLMRLSTEKYSHIVGGDTAHEKLGKPLDMIYDKYLCHYRSNARALASLARQLNRKYCMIESFHSVGWSMTLQDAKWMIDYLGIQGINFFNFHAFYYTIDALVKHDAPPSQFFQNPYWKHYRKLADYVGRISVWNTCSNSENHVAVLDPVASLWCVMANGFQRFRYVGTERHEEKTCKALITSWIGLCKDLLYYQVNYDHLDGDILAEAVVEDGRLCLGKAVYDSIVLPPTICIEEKAMDKLIDYAKQGGKLLIVGQLPNHVAGGADGIYKFHKLLVECENVILQNSSEEAAAYLKNQEEFQIQVSNEGEKEFLYSLRRDEKKQLMIFAANHGKKPMDVSMSFPKENSAFMQVWDMEQGKILHESPFVGEVHLKLDSYESAFVRLTKEREKRETEGTIATEQMVVSLEGQLDGRAESPNLYRLGTWQISFDEKNWRITTPKTLIEQLKETELLESTYLRFTGEFGVPQKIGFSYPLSVCYKTQFQVRKIPGKMELFFDCHGLRGDWRLLINGCVFTLDETKERIFYEEPRIFLDISEAIIQGENQIEIFLTADGDFCGLRDPLYLMGNFGVYGENNQWVIDELPEKLVYSGKYIKGFPFYCGWFILRKYVKIGMESLSDQFFLRIQTGEELHDCAEVFWNGKFLGAKVYAPYTWLMEKGDVKRVNQLELRICNTLSNMLDGTYFDYERHEIVTI